jgi:hypothetical protein
MIMGLKVIYVASSFALLDVRAKCIRTIPEMIKTLLCYNSSKGNNYI